MKVGSILAPLTHARSLSLTPAKVAFVAVKDMFTGSVTDVCWSPDGLRLAMSSQNGSVAIVEFTEAEIGRPISDSSFYAVLERAYGVEASRRFAANRARSRELCLHNLQSQTLSFSSGVSAQKETVGAKGRKRITPVSLTGPGFGQASEEHAPLQHSRSEQQQQQQQQTRTSNEGSNSSAVAQPTNANAPLQIKRRSDVAEGGGAAAGKRSTHSHQQQQQQQQLQQQQHHGSNHASSSFGSSSLGSSAAACALQARIGGAAPLLSAADSSSLIQSKNANARSAPASVALDPAECSATTRLQGGGTSPSVLALVKAASSSSAAATLSRGNTVLWRHSLPANPCCCSGVDSAFSVVICSDSSMHCFAPDGERISLPMRIEAPVARVMTRAHLGSFYVLVLSCSGRFKLFDLKQQRCICSGDVEPFMSPHAICRSVDMQLLPTGVPLVMFGSSAWAYHSAMQSWMCVCDSSTAALQQQAVPPPPAPSILESIELACGCALNAPPALVSSTMVPDYMHLLLQRLQVSGMSQFDDIFIYVFVTYLHAL
jgi:hypothetical protein